MKKNKAGEITYQKFASWMSTSSLWKEHYVISKEAYSKNDILYNGSFF